MNTKIYLVRHAETVGNIENRLTGKTDFKISERGKESIKLLTKKLSNIKFDSFYSSITNRTMETIEPLAHLNKKEIVQLEELGEMDFGEYDGMTWKEVNRINPLIKLNQIETNEIVGIPKQEKMEDVAERMQKCISKIINKNRGQIVIICSHGVSIEAFLRRILNVPFNQERKKFCQHNTAINELEVNQNGQYNFIRMSDISHIEKTLV